MLSLSRKATGYALFALSAAPAAWSQEWYFVPKVETAVEYNTNREMFSDPDQRDPSQAYKATAEGTLGYLTPTSDTTARPRIVYQDFPDRSGVDPVSLFLDARTRRKTERLDTDLIARFSRQDTFNAEYGKAAFDDFDPSNPGTDETGIVLVGNTRTSYSFGPKIRYNLTPRALVGTELSYERVNYESDAVNSRVGYKSPYAELTGIYEIGQRSEIEVGPYWTKFESDDGDKSDSIGAVIALHHEWTEVNRADVQLRFESTDNENIDDTNPTGPRIKDTSSNFGLEFVGYRRNRVGYFRYALGRFLTPTGLGQRRETDQIRLEYNRPMTARLQWGGSGRFMQDRALGDTTTNSGDRDRAYGELYVSYSMTQEWYVRGGYRFAYFDDKNSTAGSAENHTAFITFGYQAISPPGRFRPLRQNSQ